MKSSSAHEQNPKRVFLVEDEKKLVSYLKKGLEQEGYAVDYCLNGIDAQKTIALQNEFIDIIILDRMLPLQGGIEVCEYIRTHAIDIPVLMLTAKDTSENIVEGFNAGADDYLIKPFSFDVLLVRLKALLRRHKSTSTHKEIKIAGLALNTETRKVYFEGKEIMLTLREFNLLEYLMKHKNRVLNREQILENIWDINFDSFSNVVDVHMSNLRKKFKEVAHEEILETVRGVGYRIKG